MADKNTNHQKREIFELKLINSLLLKEVSKSINEINGTNFDNEIVDDHLLTVLSIQSPTELNNAWKHV